MGTADTTQKPFPLIENDDLPALNALLEKHPGLVHSRGRIGDIPPHWPAHNHFSEIVSMLFDTGADIEGDDLDWAGDKPLHWKSGHAADPLRILPGSGANVNSRNVRKGSEFIPMTSRIMITTQAYDCSEVTGLLLAAGADPDLQRSPRSGRDTPAYF